jgi:hypothetical protein
MSVRIGSADPLAPSHERLSSLYITHFHIGGEGESADPAPSHRHSFSVYVH